MKRKDEDELPENKTLLAQPQILVTVDRDPPPFALQRGPKINVRKYLWDIVFKGLCKLRELSGTEYISLPRQEIKDIEAFLMTLEKFNLLNDIPENGYLFHVRDVIPKEIEPYLCGYILTGEWLNYITFDGEAQRIIMSNMDQFFIDLIQLNLQLNPEGFTDFCLSPEQINILILSNEGQPPEEKNDEFIRKKAAVFFLIKKI